MIDWMKKPLIFCAATMALATGSIWADNAAPPKHWAYVKPVASKLPAVKLKGWTLNPIDYFVLARLEMEGLKPSPPASRETLIRRVTLDLIGLPPTTEEVDAFLADKQPGAYERVVDRLLASPRYGERWTRPWLDLARYADSNGYEKDSPRSIWPYRDWVINALNKDMPYDQFTIEQIAGDLLAEETSKRGVNGVNGLSSSASGAIYSFTHLPISESPNDMRIATGFHRNTMLNEEGGVDQAEQRWLTNVDRVGTTGQVWLGTTLQCTQCHDHKFDPFTQKEFYKLFAFFEHTDEPSLDMPSPETDAKREKLNGEIASQEKVIKDLGTIPDKAKLDAENAKLAALKKQIGGLHGPSTLVMAEKPDKETPSTYLRIKGGFLAKGEKVSAAVPAVLNSLPPDKPLNRLALAYWIVDKNNPLTARVQVNRAWEAFFGRGIVETSEDFGTQGRPPSHPELLNWLAVAFMADDGRRTMDDGRRADVGAIVNRQSSIVNGMGWNMKKLHRMIVTSATYRQSSKTTPLLLEKDPGNRLFSRGPRFRMEAEMLRDVALAAGGLLSPKIGGPSVYPVQPEGIWDVPYSGSQWNTSAGEDRYRRGLYTFWRRSSPYPSFMSFDATSREFCTVRRIRTSTPLQALTTLNDLAFFDAARGLAQRMLKEGGTNPAARITFGFRVCVSRQPTSKELAKLVLLFEEQLKRYSGDAPAAVKLTGMKPDQPDLAELAAMTVVANVMLNLDEALTKE